MDSPFLFEDWCDPQAGPPGSGLFTSQYHDHEPRSE